jgi:phospholipid/cholesterol/gamma-HCH transport system substrate-binding protein
MMADVEVGHVGSIELHGHKALVTMALDPSAGVPEGVIARVNRESVLGEQIIQLMAPKRLPESAPKLQDGATIEDTYVVPEVQNLVRQGTEVFGAIGASQLATMINESGIGFGGRGKQLKTLLRNFEGITKDYSAKTRMLKSLIANINALNAQIAPHASQHARAIANTDKALTQLRDSEHQLASALHALRRLAGGSRYILDRHVDEMRRFYQQMSTILGVIAGRQDSLRQILRWAPVHNRNTQLVEYQQFNQVLQDFVICGLNDNPDDPARACHGTKGGGPH